MEIGLVGLPNAGKSTLFNALTKANAATAIYPFTTIEPNIGFAVVPDARFDRLVEVIKPEKAVPAVVRFVDIAGLVKGASKGEGLGNRFLGHIREVDVICQVVRCFVNDIPFVANQTGPLDDIETVNTELALADLATCEKRADRLTKLSKSGNREAAKLAGELRELTELLSTGRLANSYPSIDDFADLHLLTAKPIVIVANISEADLRERHFESAHEASKYAADHGCDVVIVSAKVEAELAELDEEEAVLWREELGLQESGLDQFIRLAYHTLKLISFFTAEPSECRAWAVEKGTTAIAAARKIHSDFAEGFIKAEVVNYAKLIEDGSFHTARERGNLRLEGKDYVVNDGDVIHFKFSA